MSTEDLYDHIIAHKPEVEECPSPLRRPDSILQETYSIKKKYTNPPSRTSPERYPAPYRPFNTSRSPARNTEERARIREQRK